MPKMIKRIMTVLIESTLPPKRVNRKTRRRK